MKFLEFQQILGYLKMNCGRTMTWQFVIKRLNSWGGSRQCTLGLWSAHRRADLHPSYPDPSVKSSLQEAAEPRQKSTELRSRSEWEERNGKWCNYAHSLLKWSKKPENALCREEWPLAESVMWGETPRSAGNRMTLLHCPLVGESQAFRPNF